jgi:hypothetical protein
MNTHPTLSRRQILCTPLAAGCLALLGAGRITMAQTPAQSTGSRIEPALLKAVVRVEAPATVHTPPSVGTGFIVSRESEAGPSGKRSFFSGNKQTCHRRLDSGRR